MLRGNWTRFGSLKQPSVLVWPLSRWISNEVCVLYCWCLGWRPQRFKCLHQEQDQSCSGCGNGSPFNQAGQEHHAGSVGTKDQRVECGQPRWWNHRSVATGMWQQHWQWQNHWHDRPIQRRRWTDPRKCRQTDARRAGKHYLPMHPLWLSVFGPESYR